MMGCCGCGVLRVTGGSVWGCCLWDRWLEGYAAMQTSLCGNYTSLWTQVLHFHTQIG